MFCASQVANSSARKGSTSSTSSMLPYCGPSCGRARAGNVADASASGCSRLGLEQVELELGRDDRGEPQVLQRLHRVPQHLARIGEEGPALRSRSSRAAPARSARAPRAPAPALPGTAVEIDIRVAVAPAVVDAVEGLPLASSSTVAPQKLRPSREGLREFVATDALAAQDPEHVGLQQLELLRVGIPLEERREFFGDARLVTILLMRLLRRGARQAIAALAPSRFRISLNSRDSGGLVRLDDDVESRAPRAAPARMPAMSRLRLMRLLRQRDGHACRWRRCVRASASASSRSASPPARRGSRGPWPASRPRSTRSSPVSSRYFAAFGPASQGRSSATMPLPNRTSGAPKRQSSRRDREVAGDGELQRAAEAIAVHGGDRRLRRVPEAQDDAEVVLERAAHVRRIRACLRRGPCRGRSRRRMRGRRRRARSARTASSASAASSAASSASIIARVDGVQLVRAG